MRRLTNPRIRATSTTADILILCILLIQCALGLTTIPFSASIRDGSEMLKLVDWAQAVVTFHGSASAHLDGVAWDLPRPPGARNDHLSDLPPSPAWFTSGARRWSISPGVTRWYAPGAERWRRLPFILTGSPDEAFAPSSGIYRTWLQALCRVAAVAYRPTGSFHRLKPRRPAQAQRRRARYQTRFL
ncbi:respiratory nitrate reductase subunit gamma [Klebsiella pneumoniae]|uniref:Respiratory nitrate reductase subunit gamma n=1 Tax=Klebsiella pneumoniae TaxID=573 RepID=A0A2X3F0W5_KLEPN|nr:respiratory nitrate reductase subunit gamma [Klebsiella pneumoniae]